MHEKFLKMARESHTKAMELMAEDNFDEAEVERLLAEVETYKKRAELAKSANGLDDFEEVENDLGLPTDEDDESSQEEEMSVAKAVAVLKHGKDPETGPLSVIMREIYGGDYREAMEQQEVQFLRYLRTSPDSAKAVKVDPRQLWSPAAVKSMLGQGLSVGEIKATMVEGTDVLGGFAVPTRMADAIIQQLAGLTAVRGGGATVVTTASKSIDWLEITGVDADKRYPSALRGAWGGETQTPDEKNMTFGLRSIPVNIYTYRVPMSTSLLEDAINIESLFRAAVADTLAIDEDEAFLIGTGNRQPLGIIPGSANTMGINTVNSGGASSLTMDGLRSLRRGVASQYRANRRASLIGESDTGKDIELLKDGDSRYFVDQLMPGEYNSVVGATWRESEAMPAVAASAFPLIYGDLSGYIVVERMGLAIRRYNDSYTGINTVDFQIRRRVGGRLMEPWKLALQVVSA